MEVKVTSSTILPSPTSHHSDIPLTIFDRFAANIHIYVIYAFTPPTPSNADLISALSKTLVYFPTLTANLSTDCHGRPCVSVGGPHEDRGALVVEATVLSKLEDHLPLTPSPDLRLLHPDAENPKHLLQVQLNRFQCGGLVIGLTSHHRVADGRSMCAFTIAWGKILRGVPIDPLPFYDQPWLKPRNPPLVQFDHWGSEFIHLSPQSNEFIITRTDVDPSEITNLLLHFSPDFITKLKAQTNKLSTDKHTTFETLLGYLWRKMTIARQLDDEECTTLSVSVNGRRRLQPTVPPEFFGNLVLNAYPKAKAKALIEGGAATAAGIVREGLRFIGEDYFQSFIDFGEVYGDRDLVPCFEKDGNVLSPKIEVDGWLGLGFDEVNFGGGGKLCAFLPTWVPFEGLLIFSPSLSQSGGVDVFVSLLEKHAVTMREISHSLD
ncbi:tryptamine hydroxycinnamoyltransferase 1-like [Dioscorea cayenensis subsp. rotundata]|uniref:Tryptamine hydroxycinnamoyltransferase 1-like n=1 Tax=Dioscorea cayennensis subsp. rotundata TaxID=55577 RepID=A0AB40AG43_DIOCR|nr:tryptamine hydroxycinnamoyltransferase 1-like [Dioscorea cayenensis subsp. rotundata]